MHTSASPPSGLGDGWACLTHEAAATDLLSSILGEPIAARTSTLDQEPHAANLVASEIGQTSEADSCAERDNPARWVESGHLEGDHPPMPLTTSRTVMPAGGPMRRVSRLVYHLTSVPVLLWGIREWGTMAAAFLGRSFPEPFVITLRRSGLRFRVRSSMDVWVLRETCLGREYERYMPALQDGWNVVDIGAAFGDFAIWVAARFPQSTVYACEPFPGSFALLGENLKLNRVGNVRALPYAVGGRSGPMSLGTGTGEAVEFRTAGGEQPGRQMLEVPGRSLEDLFREQQIESCDFLKLDCEGAEYEILFGASEATLGRIRHLCLEYHDGVTAHTHLDLQRFLVARGFRARVHPNRAWRNLGLLCAWRAADRT